MSEQEKLIQLAMQTFELQSKMIIDLGARLVEAIGTLRNLCPHNGYEDMTDPQGKRFLRCKICHMRKP